MFKALQFLPWMKSKKPMKKITLGICAMDKKAQSKPMREILSRLPADVFEIVMYGDECILNTPVEEWPVVEVLITFYSTRFPTEKALAYVKLRNPFLVNDLEMSSTLRDRRKVYELLLSQGIEIPHHVYCNREVGVEDPNVVEEFDEYIMVNGIQVNKPLVEKPVNAEDHNIYIYYPMSAGGGSKRLFRKVKDRSSEFYPHINELRREGSFIYEEFVITQGTDVKVYTVGADYGHAEARKSPVVDGRVKRDNEGLEVRYPVILSPEEKIMARKIVRAFKQTVCGFDILRVQGHSYCCDVNGFSFVKNSRKYYDDASQILTELMIGAVRPEFISQPSTQAPLVRTLFSGSAARQKDRNAVTHGARPPSVSLSASSLPVSRKEYLEDRATNEVDMSMHSVESSATTTNNWRRGAEHQEELRCVIAIIRHADRTPKQKMKIKISEQKYLDYFHSFVKSPRKDLKVKSKSGLLQFLQVTKDIIAEQSATPSELLWKLIQIRDVLDHKEISGINRKLQMKPQKWADEPELCAGDGTALASPAGQGLATEIQLILKWGGDLTPLGRDQAESLGAQFRHVNYPDMENGGVLRLHSTYRHDLKIKASDEGRVMKTAAAFTKGLLELEGQLTPILASLVTVEEKNRQMLDRGGNFEIKEDMDRCKQRLDFLQVDEEMSEELVNLVAPGCSKALREALFSLKNPLRSLHRMHALITEITAQLSCLCSFPVLKVQVPSHQHPSEGAMDTATSPLTPASVVGLDLNHDSKGQSYSDLATVPEGPNDAESNDVDKDSEAATPVVHTTTSVGDLSIADIHITDNGVSSSPPTATAANGTTSTGRNTPMSFLSDGEGETQEGSSSRPVALYLNETVDLMFDRWDQICKAFYSSKTSKYDLTKVPDVYDMVKYDILHNSHLSLKGIEELYTLADAFENCVVPQEYGTDQTEKRFIGSKMCSALLEKINLDLNIALKSSEDSTMLYQLDESHADDLRINSLGRSVRTRLYFTSESHMHTLLNVLRYSGEGEEPMVCKEGLALMDSISEISYLSQIVIRLFEDRANPLNFHCELSFSPGAVNDPTTDKSNSVAPYTLLDKGIKYGRLIDHLESAIKLSRQDDASRASESNLAYNNQRHGSVEVNMNQAGDSDNWEASGLTDSAVKKKKDKKDKKDKN